MIKAVLLVIAVMLTAVIMPPINNGALSVKAAPQANTNDSTFSLEKRITLNNSYYTEVFQLFRTGDPRYYNTMIYGYDVGNIDGDNYPDIVLWRLKNISIWSYKKRIYASVSTSHMYDKPIIIDYDNDGKVDYILLIEHNSYDARTYHIRYANRIWTRIYRWFPTSGIVEKIADVSVHASSKTHVLIGDLLILTTIINIFYPYSYPSYFIIKIGIIVMNLDNGYTGYYELYTTKLQAPSIYDANDISTTYEAYIYRGSDYKILVVPQGLDIILIASILPQPHLIKKIDLQKPNTPTDRLIIIPQNTFYHSPGTHTPVNTVIRTNRYYWTTRISDAYVKDNTVIIPYGYFYYETPNDWVWGRSPYIRDLVRTERLAGIFIVNIENGEITKIPLLGLQIEDYIIRAVTSVNILDGHNILLGCIAQYTRTRDLSKMKQTMILELTTTNNWASWTIRILHIVPMNYYYTRGYPIIPVAPDTYLSISYLYINGVEVPFHRTLIIPGEVMPTYAYNPLLAHNTTWIDIDGDGEKEYVTIVQYQRSSYTHWGSEPLAYIPPYVLGGGAWLLVFKHPVIRLKANGTRYVGGKITLEVSVETTPISRTVLSIVYNDTVIDTATIEGSGNQTLELVLGNAGEYRLVVDAETMYYVYNSVFTTSKPKQLVKFTEHIEIPVIIVQYPTRIRLLQPKYNVMTPNTYSDGLLVEAILEYYNPRLNQWISIAPVPELELAATMLSATTTYSLILDPDTNTYKAVIHGLKPSILNLTIRFEGYQYYAPISNTTSLRLEKYRVGFHIEKPDMIPALTSFQVRIETYYQLIVDGKWVQKKLSEGSIGISIGNNTIAIIPSGTGVVEIPYSTVIPPHVSMSITYIPPNGMEELYMNKSTETSIIVEPLDINATPTHLKYYRDKTIRILETHGELVRNITADYTAMLRNKTTIISLSVENNTILLDYSTIDPGNYTLIIKPITYTAAYSRPIYYFNITISPPDIWMNIDVDPLIMVNNTYTTYTLVPVNITPIIASPVLRLTNSPVLHINNDEITADPNKTMTMIFKKPGTYNITLTVDYYGLLLNYTVHVTVLPHPVRLAIDSVNGSIIITTRDLLGRPAPGNISLTIYYESRRIYGETLPSNGSLLVNTTWLPHSRYLVEALFRGNESYAPATNKSLLELDPPIEPLPEPMSTPILLLSLLTLLYRVYRKGKGKQ